jgi:hypothetical protein
VAFNEVAVERNNNFYILLGRLISTTCVLLLPSRSLLAEEQLDLLRAAHRSARESIRTISASVRSEASSPNIPVIQAVYWRSLNTARIQMSLSSGDIVDVLVKDSEIRQVGSSKDQAGRQHYMARRAARSGNTGPCDAWGEMLIDFYTPDGKQVDFDRFLGLAKRPPQVRGSRISMSIDRPARGDEVHYTLWLDPSRNYLVRKIEMVFGDSGSHFEAENVEFIESQPGIFIPTRCVRKTWGKHGYSESVTSLSDVRVNEPIPDRIFRLPAIPSGTSLDDEVRGTKYRINSQWQRISKVEPRVTLVVAAPAVEVQEEYHTPSTSEPRSPSRWILLASLLLLAGLGMAWFVRRQRRRRDDE